MDADKDYTTYPGSDMHDESKCKYCGKDCSATCEQGLIHMDMLEADELEAYSFTEEQRIAIAKFIKTEYFIGDFRAPQFINELEVVLKSSLS